MKRFGSLLAISIALFFSQGCSPSAKSGQPAVENKEPATGHQMNAMQHEGHAMSESEHGEDSTTTQAKLTVANKITPNTPVPVVINIQDSNGKAIANFDRFQEKLMHLIVVSDDLQFFNHIHPIYKGNGRFEVETKFPQAGGYTLISDYKPAQATEQVSVLKVQVPGQKPAPTSVDFNHTKTFGDTKVSLTFDTTNLKAGQEVTMMFNLQDAKNDRPITDLQPYLGEKGHLVILKQSSDLTRADYIHAHAIKDTAASRVSYMTQFPQPGKYKLWGQFNRNGKIVTADFWVNVL